MWDISLGPASNHSTSENMECFLNSILPFAFLNPETLNQRLTMGRTHTMKIFFGHALLQHNVRTSVKEGKWMGQLQFT